MMQRTWKHQGWYYQQHHCIPPQLPTPPKVPGNAANMKGCTMKQGCGKDWFLLSTPEKLKKLELQNWDFSAENLETILHFQIVWDFFAAKILR